jgi:hypothetical protein
MIGKDARTIRDKRSPMTQSSQTGAEILNFLAHMRAIFILVLLGGCVLLALYSSRGTLAHPFGSTSDATIYAEVGFAINDPTLYANDPVISSTARGFVSAFFLLLPDAWESLENVEITYLSLSFLFALVFAIGIYLLIVDITRHQVAAFLAALVSLFVSRSLMETPTGWGVRVITPRFVVFGLSPVLLWLYWRWRHTWLAVIVFAAFGVLMLIHPRFSIYPVTIATLGLLFQDRPPLRHWARIALCVAVFAPFLLAVLFLTSTRVEGGILARVPSSDENALEKDPYAFPSRVLRPLAFSIVDASVPVILCALGWLDMQKRAGGHQAAQESLVIFSLVPLALYTILWIAIWWLPWVKLIGIERFLTYACLIPYAYGTYWIAERWKERSLKPRLIATIALIALLLVTYRNLSTVFLQDNPVYRQLVDLFYDRLAPDNVQEHRTAVLSEAGQAGNIEDDWESFHALCDWARTETDVGDVFVVPPRNFSLFRLYSQRSLFVSAKNLGGLWDRYQATTTAYVSGDFADFEGLQTLGRADYIVVERDEFTLSAPLVYENRRYLVYDLSPAP